MTDSEISTALEELERAESCLLLALTYPITNQTKRELCREAADVAIGAARNLERSMQENPLKETTA